MSFEGPFAPPSQTSGPPSGTSLPNSAFVEHTHNVEERVNEQILPLLKKTAHPFNETESLLAGTTPLQKTLAFESAKEQEDVPQSGAGGTSSQGVETEESHQVLSRSN